MKSKIFWILSILLCNALICAADAAADFKAAVDAAGKEFSAAIAAKDAARVGMLYAKDAIALPPNSEMVQGREAIQALWKGFIDSGFTAPVEAVETELDGKFGIEVGKYTTIDAAGKTVDQGKYVVVWKKEDGSWKLYRDIWNTNMPATP
jgi:uncharacterized protein (TIGR02246 family)